MKNLSNIIKLSSLFILLLLLFSLSLESCGSDDSSKPGVIISGVVSKGPINDGNVTIYALDSAGNPGTILGTASTPISGAK